MLLRTWFNTLMHVVNESSGGEHPAAFLLAGVLAMLKRTHPGQWAALQNELQDLTLRHGYGKLPSDGSILQQRYDIL